MNSVTGEKILYEMPECCGKCPYHFMLPYRKNRRRKTVDTLFCMCKLDSHFIPDDKIDKGRYHCPVETDDTIQVKDSMSW